MTIPTRREGFSFRFTHAIARSPARSVVKGLRVMDRGEPDYEAYLAEHEAYVAALTAAGLEVEVLAALDDFPDSVFVEDTALCLPEGIIILRPGAASRLGEAKEMGDACRTLGYPAQYLAEGGRVDGGDVLVTDREILVGLSARTDAAGFERLDRLLSSWDYQVLAVTTPGEVLHFKSDCCVLDAETVLATRRLSGADCFRDYRVIEVPEGEEAAANSIRVNETVLTPAGFPATADCLDRAGYDVQTVPAGQAALLDGGLSCQSLRFMIRG